MRRSPGPRTLVFREPRGTIVTRRLLPVSTLVLLIFAPAAVFAGVTPITECGTVITEPGKYKLTQDLLACPGAQINTYGGPLLIASSNVKLDLNGHTIQCDWHDYDWIYGHGIFAFGGISNVHIKNGTITGCNSGIVFVDVIDSSIKEITVSDSKVEHFLDGSSFAGIGIWLVRGYDVVTKHNMIVNNEAAGIYDTASTGNKISHNVTNGNGDQGIWIDTAQHSKVRCNTVHDNPLAGILLSGNASTGNVVKGNVVSGSFGGIAMLAFSTDEMPFGNTFRGNQSEGNIYDLSEAVFTGAGFVVEEGATCQNNWKKNRYVTQVGPLDCIGPPVELDEDDICALDDDEDDD